VHISCTTTDFSIAIEAGREGSRASRLDPPCFQPRDPKSQGGGERALSVGLSRKVVQLLLHYNVVWHNIFLAWFYMLLIVIYISIRLLFNLKLYVYPFAEHRPKKTCTNVSTMPLV